MPNTTNKNLQITLYITQAQDQMLNMHKVKTGMPKSEAIRRAIAFYLTYLEMQEEKAL